ncbi:hypothetical protein AACH06_17875 [Ideonella sp. DXS29W]|uniref:Uncharacterized protein n=1 Tax=Ideonella lacteola TaxID=2984193 RepID=A0ABU9BRU8_9BURK
MKAINLTVALTLSTCALPSQALSLTEIDKARAAGTLKEVVIFGSSSLSTLIGSYMKSVVCGGAADYDEFWDDVSGKNFRAYSCTMAIASGYPKGSKLLVIKRDKDDSIYGVHQVALNMPGKTMVVNALACSEYKHQETPAATCDTTESRIPTAGMSDVAPAMFPRTYTVAGVAQQALNYPDPTTSDDTGNPWTPLTKSQLNQLDTASVGQTIYGVVVTTTLRNNLQMAQGLPAGSDDAAHSPSLSTAFVSGVLSGFVRGGSQPNYASWKSVTGRQGDETKGVVICRGAGGNGIQAVSNAHFLRMTASIDDEVTSVLHDTAQGLLTPLASGQKVGADGVPVPGVVVNEGDSAAAIESCLRLHAAEYAIAVLPRTRNPNLHGYAHRFVRLDGVLAERTWARTGAYPFVYTSSMQWRKTINAPDAQTKAFLIGVRANAASSNKLVYYVNSEAPTGLMASPHRWQERTDTCANTTDLEDAIYGSCVERVDEGDATYNPGSHVYDVHTVFRSSSGAPLHLVR